MTAGIKDKVVVVTGASSGLGEATARLLSAEGATVVLGARRADRLRTLAKELETWGAKALALTTDVSEREQVKELVDAAVQTYGRVDVMINNAGLMPLAPLERLKVDEWDRMIDVNIKGVLYGIAAALPHMKPQKAGHIINVSSVAGHKVGPGAPFMRHQVCRPGPLGGAATGGEAVQHPHDGHLARRRRDGASRQHHRSGCRRSDPDLLCAGRGSCRLVRPGGRVRDQPAGGCRRERNPLPADAGRSSEARMSVTIMHEPVAAPRVAATVLPIMGVVFVAFLVIGVAMPVLPLHVHDGLGLGTFVVGLVAGSQFAASLISRPWAGHYSDSRGAKRGVIVGLLAAAASGLLYLLSLGFSRAPLTSVAILLRGARCSAGRRASSSRRAVSWGLALADPQTHRQGHRLGGVGDVRGLRDRRAGSDPRSTPPTALRRSRSRPRRLRSERCCSSRFLPAVAPVQHARPSFVAVVGAVWVPGFGSALGSVGFGAVTTFVALLFANRGWANGWLAYTAYAGAFILARVFFSHLADAIGGRRSRWSAR